MPPELSNHMCLLGSTADRPPQMLFKYLNVFCILRVQRLKCRLKGSHPAATLLHCDSMCMSVCVSMCVNIWSGVNFRGTDLLLLSPWCHCSIRVSWHASVLAALPCSSLDPSFIPGYCHCLTSSRAACGFIETDRSTTWGDSDRQYLVGSQSHYFPHTHTHSKGLY